MIVAAYHRLLTQLGEPVEAGLTILDCSIWLFGGEGNIYGPYNHGRMFDEGGGMSFGGSSKQTLCSTKPLSAA